jgi:hypothetical protein
MCRAENSAVIVVPNVKVRKEAQIPSLLSVFVTCYGKTLSILLCELQLLNILVHTLFVRTSEAN